MLWPASVQLIILWGRLLKKLGNSITNAVTGNLHQQLHHNVKGAEGELVQWVDHHDVNRGNLPHGICLRVECSRHSGPVLCPFFATRETHFTSTSFPSSSSPAAHPYVNLLFPAWEALVRRDQRLCRPAYRCRSTPHRCSVAQNDFSDCRCLQARSLLLRAV